jgi:hypothetical protein
MNKFGIFAVPLMVAIPLFGVTPPGWTQNPPTPSESSSETMTEEEKKDQYINKLYNFLEQENYEEALSIAQNEFNEKEHIATAKKSCQLLEDGVANVEELASGLVSNIIQNMDKDDLQVAQRPLGEYLGVSIVLSSIYYCPQHQTTVQELFIQ